MTKPIDMLNMGPTRTERKDGDKWIVTVTPPSWSGFSESKSVELSQDQYERYLLWRDGPTLIQMVLSDLTSADREILMTGVGPEDFPIEEEP